MEYQSVPVPEDLINTMNKTDSSDNNIQINHCNSKQRVVWDDHSNNKDDDSQTPSNNKDNSEDGGHDELDNSQHPDDLKSYRIVNHEDQVILTQESYNSTSVSVTRLTNIDTFLPSLFLRCLYKIQGLSLQYLHKTVITILCLPCLYENTSTVVRLLSSLWVSLWMSLHDDILHHLHKGISTIMVLLLSLYTSLPRIFLQPPLLASLRSGFL